MNPDATGDLVFEFAPDGAALTVRGKAVPEGAIYTIITSPSSVNSRAPQEGTQWVMKGAYGFTKRMREGTSAKSTFLSSQVKRMPYDKSLASSLDLSSQVKRVPQHKSLVSSLSDAKEAVWKLLRG